MALAALTAQRGTPLHVAGGHAAPLIGQPPERAPPRLSGTSEDQPPLASHAGAALAAAQPTGWHRGSLGPV